MDPEPAWRRSYPALVIGRTLKGYDQVTSTMDVAWALVGEGAEHGTAVQAMFQSNGRGRFARRWVSDRGDSLLLSVILRPSTAIEVSALTMVATLAAHRAIQDLTGALEAVKWPNDLHHEGKKLGGVLVESQPDPSGATAMVAGIGLNLKLDLDRHPEISDIATSHLAETGVYVDPESAALAVLRRLDAGYAEWVQGGDVAARWREVIDTLGNRVVVHRRHGALQGIAQDIDSSGRLLVRDEAGTIHAVSGDEASLSG